MIDVVYVLGKGSRWNNNEIRFSLRSIEKHLKNYGKVWVVGECPKFLKDVIHVPFPDCQKAKENNIYIKIAAACKEQVSDEFLLFNDDHFLNSDFDTESFPFFYQEKVSDVMNARTIFDNYYRALYNTHLALSKKEAQEYYYDVHTPIRIHKRYFLAAMPFYFEDNFIDSDIDKYGYVVKSLYANSIMDEPGTPYKDVKITQAKNKEEIEEQIKNSLIFSTGESHFVKHHLRTIMPSLYPDKSKWEKDSPDMF
jgi:hypothetical protein